MAAAFPPKPLIMNYRKRFINILEVNIFVCVLSKRCPLFHHSSEKLTTYAKKVLGKAQIHFKLTRNAYRPKSVKFKTKQTS